jgi:hypothetical protein
MISAYRMFFYLLVLILLNYGSVDAVPILIDSSIATTTDDSKSVMRRTLFGIIWSCVSTIIICAWTAVHPNVPPPNQWKARWNRVGLMFWMIIAPELVLAWAVRQFFAAREIRDEYNSRHPGASYCALHWFQLTYLEKLDLPSWRKWTLKHGHLLEMGGFILIDPDLKYAEPSEQNGIVLTLQYLKENPGIEILEISAANIKDRSKGDALSKIIAILQTTWFIAQCVARGQQRIALTELELVTLALASLNAVTYGIWWHKPLGLQDPIKVYTKTEVVEKQDPAQKVGVPTFFSRKL